MIWTAKLRRLFRNNRLLVRLVLSFLITGALLTGLLMLLVSGFVSGSITRQSHESASQLLRQAYVTSYNALTDVYGDFYYLWSKEPVIQEAMAAASLSAEQSKSVSKLLDATAFRDPLVHSVCLINETAGLVLSNQADRSDLATFYDAGALALFHDFEKNYDSFKNEVFFPRQASFLLAGQKENRSYISIVLASQAADGQLHGGLIVNIDQTRFSALVNSDPANGQMMVVNRSGKIISDQSGSLLGLAFPEAALYQGILADPGEDGSLTASYQGEQSFITYKKAATLGFVFIDIIPLAKLMETVQKTNRTIALLFIGAIILSLIASALAARQIYQPLSKLVRAMQDNPSIQNDLADSGQDEYAYLGEAFGNLIAQNQQAHLARLIQGHFSSRTLDILGFSRARFLTVAVIPDQPELAGRVWLEQLSQVVQKTIRLPAAVIAADTVGLIFNADRFDETEMDWILAQIATLQRSIEANMQATVSIGLGSVVDDAASIKASYRNALAAAQQAAALGSSQMVPYSEIENNRLNANQNRSAIAAAIDEAIQANYPRPGFTIEEIAEQIGLSVGYMRQIFKLERGVPINDQIIACRINKARELLASTDMTAKDISESVGYLDSRYFYTLFKKKVGMTTDEYRRSAREEARHEEL